MYEIYGSSIVLLKVSLERRHWKNFDATCLLGTPWKWDEGTLVLRKGRKHKILGWFCLFHLLGYIAIMQHPGIGLVEVCTNEIGPTSG